MAGALDMSATEESHVPANLGRDKKTVEKLRVDNRHCFLILNGKRQLN